MDTCLGLLVQINTLKSERRRNDVFYTQNFKRNELRTGNNEHIVDYLWTW